MIPRIIKLINHSGREKKRFRSTSQTPRGIRKRAETAKYWLDMGYADGKYRFSVAKELPAVELTADEKQFLKDLASKLEPSPWDAEAIGQTISELGKESAIGNKGAFKTLYRILIAQDRGPRLGNFLASMDRSFVVGRIKEAAL